MFLLGDYALAIDFEIVLLVVFNIPSLIVLIVSRSLVTPVDHSLSDFS